VSLNGGIVALIPARGGSKGIPRKNIKPLGGKPLIAHSIEIALASSLIDRVVVSTEDVEIAMVARQFGAEVPFTRPEELARDDSPELLTWKHAIRELRRGTGLEVLVCVSATSPLRNVEDVDRCIQALLDSDSDLVITVKQSERNPYFNMVVLDNDGYASLATPSPHRIFRRQDAPQMYDVTTVAYAARPDYVMNCDWLFEGKIKSVEVPSERAIDIDTELDFTIAEILLAQTQR